MSKSDQSAKKGISIRITHIAMIVLAVIIIALLFFSGYQSSSVFSTLSAETGKYAVRQKAAHDLMEASDYLTEQVQRFTLDGDMQFLTNYFNEADNSRRRESAIVSMSESGAEADLVARVQEAMDESLSLMHREYYAMRLVIDAKGYWDYPATLDTVELSEEDVALSPEEKMDKARTMVMDDAYFTRKGVIRSDLSSALSLLDQSMSATKADLMNELNSRLTLTRVLMVILGVAILAVIWITARLGTQPLLKAVKETSEGKPAPVVGSTEFRLMASRYNEMFTALHPEEKDASSEAEEE